MKTILIIRDGWGYRKSSFKNAIKKANPKFHESLIKNYPNTLIKASGLAVGLPKNFQGNSEVGHITIGSGRIITQSLQRINKEIKDKSFFKNPQLLKAINNCKINDSTIHIIGLLQTQGVHSHTDHIKALIDLCKINKLKKVKIHAITDGRDAPVKEGITHLTDLINYMKPKNLGEIATISGRYYAMDRDKRWNRTKKSYEAIVNAKSSEKFTDSIIALKNCYKNNETDEFIIPKTKEDYQGIKENDSIIFFNYRTDRPRQLTQAIIEPNFKDFETKKLKVFFVPMTNYYNSKKIMPVFNEIQPKNFLGQILAKNNLKQLRISETEKYAHVTYFMNCQIEKPFFKEDRILIPSPKVATYDLMPKMSAEKISNELGKQIKKKIYDFIAVNLVNCDMVGHTGKTKAIIKAVKTVDLATQKIVNAGLKNDYAIIITADHGNAEDQTIKWRTSHTINPVPLIIASNNLKINLKKKGELQDLAPTILKLLRVKKPKEMTGKPLF